MAVGPSSGVRTKEKVAVNSMLSRDQIGPTGTSLTDGVIIAQPKRKAARPTVR